MNCLAANRIEGKCAAVNSSNVGLEPNQAHVTTTILKSIAIGSVGQKAKFYFENCSVDIVCCRFLSSESSFFSDLHKISCKSEKFLSDAQKPRQRETSL